MDREPNPNTKVSVIIPAYNAAQHISRAIESCLTQTVPPHEIIVVDDGSVDETAEIVRCFEPRVRLVRKTNGGPASARNRGAAAAHGNWLALLDADDWWFPTKLERQLVCDTNPNIGLIHCLAEHRPERPPATLSFNDLWARNWIVNSSVLIRHTAFTELGGFDEAARLISVEDYNLWLRLAASEWIIVSCPEILVHYTRGIGLSSNADQFMNASLYNIDDLEARLELPVRMANLKRSLILLQFGQQAIYLRHLRDARQLLLRSLKMRPSFIALYNLAIASSPRVALDLKRAVHAHMTVANRDGEVLRPRPSEKSLLLSSRPLGCIPGRRPGSLANTEAFSRPVLICTVDAEESFDWTGFFSRSNVSVVAMRQQYRAHRVFARYGMVPIYLVDYPVATQDAGRAPLLDLLGGDQCEIGAQLHPWVTPPHTEPVTVRNTFPSNLPPALEHEKLRTLTNALMDTFDVSPRVYRAGRYGLGVHTIGFLKELGYQVDTSVVPFWSFGAEGGPDYRQLTAEPFWLDAEQNLLELSISAGLVGRTELPLTLFPNLFDGLTKTLKLPAVLARLKLLERIKLTPEGIAIDEAKRLVRHMTAHGHKIFVLTYHSPSLEPGNTPYVRNEEELRRFLAWIDEFLDFFTTEIGGRCARWAEVYASLQKLANPP